MRWARHVVYMGEMMNVYRILVGKPKVQAPLGRSRRRWEENIKIDLREIDLEGVEWIILAQDRDLWRAHANEPLGSTKDGEFLN
jgi:hypothetical protein